jgi:hypothetical protein
VAIQARTLNYNSEARATNVSAAGGQRQSSRLAPRAPDGQEECLQLLARAVQQFHTYPPASPLCRSAIDASHHALTALAGREQLDIRVTPRELIVGETPIGRGTIVEHELAKRLHAASIAQVTIERAAPARELTHFCLDLLRCSGGRDKDTGLVELLGEHGVNRIAVRPAFRPEVLQVRAASPAVAGVIEQQRRRRDELFATNEPVNHLYPPDRGWVRLDPSSVFTSISLADLALLADDPATLARMLLRLTDDAVPESDATGEALTRKFSDVARLFASLDPRVARVMFSKLASAVLELDPEPRQNLLRRTILPGLLDGKIDGAVLRDFPDLDLADSLCLLLDLETAAPEVLTAALARLDLPTERQDALAPLIEDRLQARTGPAGRHTTIDAHARKLLRVDNDRAKSFAEFAAFDLALYSSTLETLARMRSDIAATDFAGEQLACLWNLTSLEPNPEVVHAYVERAIACVERFESEERWQACAAWLARYRELSIALDESRPDVSDVIRRGLATLCTIDRASRLVALAEQGESGRSAADGIIRALDSDIGVALVALVARGATDEHRTTRRQPQNNATDEHRTAQTHSASDEHRTTQTHRATDEHRTTQTHHATDKHRTAQTHSATDKHRTAQTHNATDEHRTTQTHNATDEHRTTQTHSATDEHRTAQTHNATGEHRTTQTRNATDEHGTTQIQPQNDMRATAKAAARLLGDHASLVAPAIVAALGTAAPGAHRIMARVLGLAGPGYEEPLAALLTSSNEQGVREALRSLARIGTPKAAAVVRAAIEQCRGWIAGAAEETIWHFPPHEAHRQIKELLARREFVVKEPIVAARLLDRAAQAGARGLEPTLMALVPLRYRVWSPTLARVGRRAHALLTQ